MFLVSNEKYGTLSIYGLKYFFLYFWLGFFAKSFQFISDWWLEGKKYWCLSLFMLTFQSYSDLLSLSHFSSSSLSLYLFLSLLILNSLSLFISLYNTLFFFLSFRILSLSLFFSFLFCLSINNTLFVGYKYRQITVKSE